MFLWFWSTYFPFNFTSTLYGTAYTRSFVLGSVEVRNPFGVILIKTTVFYEIPLHVPAALLEDLHN